MSSIMIIYSGERTAYVLFLLLSFLIFIYLFAHFGKKLKIFSVILLSIFLISPFILSEKTSERQNNILEYSTNFDSTKMYIWHFIKLFKLFLESPIIGIGPNNLGKNESIYFC